MTPHQQRLLPIFAGLFLLLVAGLTFRIVNFRQTHFRIGEIPKNELVGLLPKTLPITALRPPAIRAIDPIRFGSATSAIGIVEYGDFTCPNCLAAAKIINTVLPSYHGNVRFLWRDLPQTDDGKDLAIFMRCAHLQGKFWNALDAIANTPKLTTGALRSIQKSLQLDEGPFKACRDSQEMQDMLEQDIQEAGADGIHQTPMLFIDTRATTTLPTADSLKQQLDSLLKTL